MIKMTLINNNTNIKIAKTKKHEFVIKLTTIEFIAKNDKMFTNVTR